MSIWRWAEHLAPMAESARVTLGEGNTPLVRSRRLGPQAGLSNLYFKLEAANPSGSYKDRFAVAAVSHMVAEQKSVCIATSSGNTGAALAAYCAAAGIRCRIAIVETAPLGKVKQMQAYGAEIFRVKGFGLDPDITAGTLEALRRLATKPGHALQISSYVYCPVGMTGCETIAFELDEQLGAGIDHVFCQAGGGGLSVAMARGFGKLIAQVRRTKSPAIECVQPEGNNTIAGPLRDGQPQARSVQCTTKVSGLQVASVVDGHLAVQECRATGGTGHLVSDEEVWSVQRRLARDEGIFTEPAGVVSLAGALRAAREGLVKPDAAVVCLLTGTAFKDEASIDRMIAGIDCPMLTQQDLEAEAA